MSIFESAMPAVPAIISSVPLDLAPEVYIVECLKQLDAEWSALQADESKPLAGPNKAVIASDFQKAVGFLTDVALQQIMDQTVLEEVAQEIVVRGCRFCGFGLYAFPDPATHVSVGVCFMVNEEVPTALQAKVNGILQANGHTAPLPNDFPTRNVPHLTVRLLTIRKDRLPELLARLEALIAEVGLSQIQVEGEPIKICGTTVQSTVHLPGNYRELDHKVFALLDEYAEDLSDYFTTWLIEKRGAELVQYLRNLRSTGSATGERGGEHHHLTVQGCAFPMFGHIKKPEVQASIQAELDFVSRGGVRIKEDGSEERVEPLPRVLSITGVGIFGSNPNGSLNRAQEYFTHLF